MTFIRSTIDIRNVSDGCVVRLTMDTEGDGQKFAETKFDRPPTWPEVMHFCEISAAEIMHPTQPAGTFIAIPIEGPQAISSPISSDPILSGPISPPAV